MYVILRHGGKQYKVSDNEELVLEKINANAGEMIDLNKLGRVLFLSADGKVNTDINDLKKIKINAKVLEHFQNDRVITFKYRAKKNYRRKRGHRQLHTKVLVESIDTGKRAKEKKTATKEIKSEKVAAQLAKLKKESKIKKDKDE